MYIGVEFLQKEQSKSFKKFLKKNRAWNGKQLGLRVAEKLIQNYIVEYQQNDKVLFLLQDVDNEKAYEFELSVRATESFSLLAAISQDLEEGTDFDQAMEIKQKVYVNYKAEGEQDSLESEVEAPQKKKGGFFSKIFGKKEEEIPHAATVDTGEYGAEVQKEFAKEENLFEEMSAEEMQQRGTNIFEESDFEHLERESANPLEQKNDDIFAVDKTEDIQKEELNLDKEELPFTTSGNDSITSIEEELFPSDSKNNQEAGEEEVSTSTQVKDVSFPEYDKFIDLREVEAKQNRYDSRFTVKHLLGLMGMSEETSKTDLEKKKLQYVKNVLSGKEFIIIQDNYYQDVNNLIDDIRLILERTYKETVMRDYQKEAEEVLRDTFEANLQGMLHELNVFESKETQEVQQKLNAFSEKQKLELQTFKLQQEAEFKGYQADLEERKLTLVSAREEELTKENNVEQDTSLHEKTYELKMEAYKLLIDKKNELLADFSGSLEDIMNGAFESQESEMRDLQEYIGRLIPEWKEEIQAERDKEMEERKLKLEEEKSKREQAELALRQREQDAREMKTSDREREYLNIIEDLKGKLVTAHSQMGTGQMPPQPQMFMYAPPVQPVVQQQPVYMYQQQPVMQQQPVQQPIQPQPAQQAVMPSQTGSSPERRKKLFDFWYKNEK
ncbi:hypothetical protein P9027_30265 [Bacillus thuringiensis]|uniref:hypothetical protein n=1 Tax=Bacillus thuringiensis TaxID=1428 RepID=UPI002DBDA0D8|nr:hypothetical protein [Bacillus thuringiensis]MEC3226203.1 hypothetical protein [Bacillus thuringiensis]MEC3463553.1 hypothetical protein [Bacillus thuringiensis]MEC3556654.1 hypothetical protein [Bacillus thuringiensis]MED2060326.1 hypothetical protein [Bacillus thuringiensis]